MQATAADSVGVKMPLRMPPMMMTTVTSPQNASPAILIAWRERDDLALGEVVAPRDVEAQDHQRQAEHQARDDAGDEQVRDRDRAAGRERIDHRVVRGRDQQRLQRARDGDVDGEQPRIAGLDHLRDHHRADRGGVGDRRARDAAEHRRGEDVHQRKAAADEADEHLGEVDEARRHAAFGHDAAGEDEERDRQQREVVHAVGGLEHDGFERQVDPERREDRREAERIGDRHAEQAQHAEAADQDEHVHGGLLGADLRDGVVGRAARTASRPTAARSRTAP